MPTSQNEADLKLAQFYEYHHATKHTIQKLYSYGHRLDWASQPDPFLRFEGAPVIDLPHEFLVSNDKLFQVVVSMVENARSVSASAEHGVLEQADELSKFLSNLLFYGVAISAWKQVVGTNNRWALRVNASSGNLHPTDTHVLISRDSGDIKAGAFHYNVREHKLEQRSVGDAVTPLMQRLGIQSAVPPVVLCMTSIFFREAWKYRERAFRYCQHDMGHALASLCLSASALGWSVRIVGIFPDEEVSEHLGLSTSDEKPLALILLCPRSDSLFPSHEGVCSLSFSDSRSEDQVETSIRNTFPLSALGGFSGKPNRLSSQIIDYPQIRRVYESTKYDFEACLYARLKQSAFYAPDVYKSAGPEPGPIQAATSPIDLSFDLKRALEICQHDSVHETIRKRRSAVDMDGETGMTLEHLSCILRSSTLGFAADFQGVDCFIDGQWASSAREHLVHLYLYVHRVEGLEPGLYYFNRFKNQLVPLLLRSQQEGAKETSCFQDIASDGAFSISMVADFQEGYNLYGNRCYRFAHYEAGYIGQMLYLSACALGHDATGIGCFVDDDINKYLALDEGKEVIYNFTIGKAVHDSRLTTLPSYSFSTPEF